MFGCNNGVYIVFAADAVVKAGEQAVGIWWQIHADYVCFFVCNVI